MRGTATLGLLLLTSCIIKTPPTGAGPSYGGGGGNVVAPAQPGAGAYGGAPYGGYGGDPYGGGAYGGGVTVGNGIPVAQIAGHWTGDWGEMYMQVGADGWIRGAYTHDTGTVMGRVGADGVFYGWWCEAPSRQPSGDAGDVEFRFTRGADGTLQLDGRWRYGQAGDFAENWDLHWTDGPVDAALTNRFGDASVFCPHP